MIYRLIYCNKDGVEARVDIQKGSATPIIDVEGTDNPFTLSYNNDKGNKSGMFLSSSADIEIYETADFNIDNLKTSNETELAVTYYINNIIKWKGFIIPDFFSIEVRNNPVITMTASDRLGTLKNVTLSDLPSMISIRELAVSCLNKTWLTLPLKTMADFSNDGTDNAFFSYYVDSQRIKDIKGRSISCYDILSSILTASNSKLVQRGGEWVIINKLQHEIGSGKLYSDTTTFTNYLESVYNFDEVSVGARRTINPVAGSVGIYHEHGGRKSHPVNYDYSLGLSGWNSVNGFVATIENRHITAFLVGTPLFDDERTVKQYLLNYNNWIDNTTNLNTAPYIETDAIPVNSTRADRVEVTIDISSTMAEKLSSYDAISFLRYAVILTNGVKTYTLTKAGIFEILDPENISGHSLLLRGGQQPPLLLASPAFSNSDSFKGLFEVGEDDNVNDYSATIRIYGSGDQYVTVNYAIIKFSDVSELPKGTMYKTEQRNVFTKAYDIETSIFGDYLLSGLDGYFYRYPNDDTSSIYKDVNTLSTPVWTTPNIPNETSELPLLHHSMRQARRMFSVAHDLLSAEIDVSDFDPLAIFVSCDKRYTVVSGSFDFFRSNVKVELEEVAFQNNVTREYIYSYFGDGETGVKSIGGISAGAGGGGGTGGGLTPEQINMLADVSYLAHTHENKTEIDKIDAVVNSTDNTVLSDDNILTSLRVIEEILKNNETIKDLFLSKVDPDTAQEIIKFVKGIEIGDFTTGPLGAGASLKMENGVSRMEVDQLDVRMRATFRELIIESLKHIGGQLILSPARMKCNKVVDGGTYYRCYFDTGDGKVSNEFVAGDQARCQVFTGSGVKMYWRLVTSVGTDWINLSKTDAISGSSIPEAGDDIVQLGHRTDTTRQNAQILSTVGSDAPSWKQYKGINAFSLEGKDTTVFSGTGNKIDGKTVFMSSGANVEDGINSKNSNYSSQPTSYKANDTWTLSADTTVNGIAYKAGEILTATQDSTTYNQAHWVKKVRYTDDSAVNNMNIGSRNFWLNSALITRAATTAAWSIASRDLTVFIENGSQVTIQFDINVDAPFNIVLYAANQSSIVFGTTLLTNLANFNLVSGKQTIKHTFNFDSSKPFIHIYKNSAELRTATVTFLMLGLGNKVTWSEAQEDIDLRINTAKQEALTAAGNAQTSANNANTAVGNLNTYVDGTFKDGVIEASEAKAIEKYINVVNTEKSNLEATYNTLYANTYLEGTPKSDLLNAKVTYFGAVDTLLGSINTAISDGKTTTAEKNAVDTNYSSYKTALASLQTAIENANKAIQTKLDTLSTDRVNNLQVGIDNVLKSSNTQIVSVGSYLMGGYTSENFISGQTYTLMFFSTANVRAFISQNVQIGNAVAGLNRMVFTYSGQTLADQTIKFYNTSSSYATQQTVSWACLYKGDVKAPNEWTESFKVVTTDIATNKLTSERAQLAADGYMRARYVRDWAKGSTVNWNNQWNEIKIFNKAGINLALGKTPSSNVTLSNPATITDNVLTTGDAIINASQTLNYVQIDLGQTHYDIDYIQIWHYYLDGRTYYGTKTEISTDGVNWTPVFDSAKSGTYKETAAGNIISFRPNEVLAKVLRSAATTDKFSGFDGGLATAVIMEMREPSTTTRGDATAGISGIQKDINGNFLPAVWTGGTYAQAVAGTARSIDKHDGSGHRAGGKLSWDAAGNLTVEGTVNATDGEFTGMVKGNAGYFEGLVRIPFVETYNQTAWWGDESGFHPIITNPATAGTNIIARNNPGTGRTTVKLPTVINGYRIAVFNGETADNGSINSWGKIEISAGTNQILNANYGFTTDTVDQYNDQLGTISVLTGRSNPISAYSMVIDFGEYVELVGVGTIGWIVTNRLKAR